MPRDPLYSIPDTAKLLGGISPYTIQAWLRQGKLHKVKIGRRTFLRESELLGRINDEAPVNRPVFAN